MSWSFNSASASVLNLVQSILCPCQLTFKEVDSGQDMRSCTLHTMSMALLPFYVAHDPHQCFIADLLCATGQVKCIIYIALYVSCGECEVSCHISFNTRLENISVHLTFLCREECIHVIYKQQEHVEDFLLVCVWGVRKDSGEIRGGELMLHLKLWIVTMFAVQKPKTSSHHH